MANKEGYNFIDASAKQAQDGLIMGASIVFGISEPVLKRTWVATRPYVYAETARVSKTVSRKVFEYKCAMFSIPKVVFYKGA